MRPKGLKTHDYDMIAHRLARHGNRIIHGGCGYMLKPTAQGAYQSRTMPALVMVAILRGQGLFTDWRDVAHEVHAGQLIVLPPHKRHGVVQQPDGQWSEFYFTAPAAIYHALRRLGTLPPPNESHVFDVGFRQPQLDAFNALHQCARQVDEHQLPLLWSHCQHLLAQLLHSQQGGRRTGDEDGSTLTDDAEAQLMHQAARLLRAWPQQRISLTAVAGELNMGYESFRKRFRQHMGVSPGDYRIAKRMELAQQLIADHHLSAKEVAYRLGYADPFTFSKQFKKALGVSPSAFRQRR